MIIKKKMEEGGQVSVDVKEELKFLYFIFFFLGGGGGGGRG